MLLDGKFWQGLKCFLSRDINKKNSEGLDNIQNFLTL